MNTQHTRIRILLALALVLIAALAGIGEVGARQAATGTFEVLSGIGSITSGDTTEDVPPGEPVVVQAGDQVGVSEDGEAVLTLFTGQQTRLAPGTVLDVDTLEESDEFTRVELNVVIGQVISAVEGTLNDESRFEVHTPNAKVSVRGTQFLVSVRDGDLTQVTTIDGTVGVTGEDAAEVEVPCGYGVWFKPEEQSDLLVWAQAFVTLDVPEGVAADAIDVPVVFTNTENDQRFYYHNGDQVSLPLGEYEMVIGTPGPARTTGIVFPEDTQPLQMFDLPVALGAARVGFVDDDGNPVETEESLIITLVQDDLQGTSLIDPGEPFTAGPGLWDVTLAFESQPDRVINTQVESVPGELVSVDVPLSAFGE